MAKTSYGVNDALAVKRWARGLAVEALKATEIAPLIGSSAKSIIHRKDETKEGGDSVTFGLRMQLTGDGVTEGGTLEGNEESLTTYNDAVLVNELSNAVRVSGEDTIDQQRVLFNLRTEARDGLKDWYAKRIAVSFFNQVCGNTAQSNTLYTGLNAVTAPSSGRHIWTNGSDDESLGSGHILTLTQIDHAKELADTADPQIRPIMIGGEEKYVMYLHPYQVTSLRTNTSTGQWLDIQKAAMNGGQVTNNPIYTGAIGEYNGVVLRKSHNIPLGVNSSTGAAVADTRRAVLLGAQAAAIAYGKKRSTGSPYKWVEQTFDYQRELGVSVQSCFGMKKCRFNSNDFGTVVVSSYAAAQS